MRKSSIISNILVYVAFEKPNSSYNHFFGRLHLKYTVRVIQCCGKPAGGAIESTRSLLQVGDSEEVSKTFN